MLFILLIGALTGAFLNLIGAAGGVVATPLLCYGLGMSFMESNFIASTLVLFNCLLSTFVKRKYVLWSVATFITIIGMIFTSVGVAIAQHLAPNFIRVLFSLVTMIIVCSILLAEFRKQDHTIDSLALAPGSLLCWENFRYLLLFLILGLISGIMSGILGVGGGFFVAPLLIICVSVTPKNSRATSLAIVAFILLFSLSYKFLYYTLQDELEFIHLLSFVVSGTVGMLIGHNLKKFIAEKITTIFCVVILILISGFEFMAHGL